jgi:hypothetical protein
VAYRARPPGIGAEGPAPTIADRRALAAAGTTERDDEEAEMRLVTKRLRWITVGVALTWFFDPVRGDERRARARAIATDLLRGTRRVAADVTAKLPPSVRRGAEGFVERLPSFDNAADRALADQIRRDVLETTAPQLLVEVRDGRVVVRGALADVRDVAGIEDRIRTLPHVVSVELRVHTPSEGGVPPTTVHSQAGGARDAHPKAG